MRAYGYMSNFMNPTNYFDKDFHEYVKNDNYTTSQGTDIILYELTKDKTVNGLTNIVLTVLINDNEDNPNREKEWAKLSPGEKKGNLIECAELVEKFLESKNITYHYRLYVNVKSTSRLGHYVYYKNYNAIWIPPCEEESKSEKDDINCIDKGYHVCILKGKFTEIGEGTSIAY